MRHPSFSRGFCRKEDQTRKKRKNAAWRISVVLYSLLPAEEPFRCFSVKPPSMVLICEGAMGAGAGKAQTYCNNKANNPLCPSKKARCSRNHRQRAQGEGGSSFGAFCSICRRRGLSRRFGTLITQALLSIFPGKHKGKASTLCLIARRAQHLAPWCGQPTPL